MDFVKIVNNVVSACCKKVVASRKFKIYDENDKNFMALKSFSEQSDMVSTETGIRIWIDCSITNEKVYQPRIAIVNTKKDVLTDNTIYDKQALGVLQQRMKQYSSLLAKAISLQKQANSLYNAIEEKKVNQNSQYHIGDIYAGTWGYSMTLSKFAILIGITDKSLRFQIIDDKPAPNNDGNPAHYPVIPDMNKKGKTVMVRMPKDSTYGVRVDGCYMKVWDGKPIYEDHMD